MVLTEVQFPGVDGTEVAGVQIAMPVFVSQQVDLSPFVSHRVQRVQIRRDGMPTVADTP